MGAANAGCRHSWMPLVVDIANPGCRQLWMLPFGSPSSNAANSEVLDNSP